VNISVDMRYYLTSISIITNCVCVGDSDTLRVPGSFFFFLFSYCTYFFFFFSFFSFFRGNVVLQLHTDVFTFYSIVAMSLYVVLFAP